MTLTFGISEFILSGYPHLEEAYWFGEGVLPELRRRGAWVPPGPASSHAADAGHPRELEVSGHSQR
jgi:alkanesulfonate monooxygenase